MRLCGFLWLAASSSKGFDKGGGGCAWSVRYYINCGQYHKPTEQLHTCRRVIITGGVAVFVVGVGLLSATAVVAEATVGFQLLGLLFCSGGKGGQDTRRVHYMVRGPGDTNRKPTGYMKRGGCFNAPL